MEAHFVNKSLLALLGLVPLVGLALYWSYRHQDGVLKKFATEEMIKKIKPRENWNIRLGKIVLFMCVIALLIFALARPRWGIFFQKIENQGRDIVILLDLSKSMLAKDVRPNRLERAKADIKDLLKAVKGDRVALVAFAGKVETRCPLTLDYNFFSWTLEECLPGTVPLGGTAIGDAIRKGVELLDEQKSSRVKDSTLSKWFNDTKAPVNARNKAIILITDGGDHDTAPEEAAALAAKKNIAIISIGLGDPKEGARIPVPKKGTFQFVKDSKGSIVWSQLNENLLRAIALKTGGIYVPVKTRNVNMADIYHNYIAKMSVQLHKSAKKKKFKEQYQVFVFLACLCLVFESLLREGSAKKISVLMIFLVLFIAGCGEESFTLEANKLYQKGKLKESQKKYQQAQLHLPNNPVLFYNQANIFYRQKKWDKALKLYNQSIDQDDERYDAFDYFFNKGCTFFRQAQELTNRASNKEHIQKIVGLLQASLKEFRLALQKRPKDKDTLSNLQFVKLTLKDYLDKLYQQQKKEKEKKTTPLDILAKIRWQQRAILRQTRLFAYEMPESLLELAPAQAQLLEELEAFRKKLGQQAKNMKKQYQQAKKPQGPKINDQQIQQLLKFGNEILDKTKQTMEKAHQKLQQKKNADQDQIEVLRLLDPLWQMLAPPQVLLQEDVAIQQMVVQDIDTLKDAKPVKKWDWTKEDQQSATSLTEFFLRKSQMLTQALAKQKQNPKSVKPPDMSKIEKIGKQAIAKQEQSAKFLKEKKQDKAQQVAIEALELLKKLLKKQKNKKNNKQQQKKKQKEQQKKKRSKSQKKNFKKNQARRLLQKAKDRARKFKKEKLEQGMVSGGRGVERDW